MISIIKINQIIFDKTGTLTIGRPLVNEIISYHHKIGHIKDISVESAISNFNNAIAKGIRQEVIRTDKKWKTKVLY